MIGYLNAFMMYTVASGWRWLRADGPASEGRPRRLTAAGRMAEPGVPCYQALHLRRCPSVPATRDRDAKGGGIRTLRRTKDERHEHPPHHPPQRRRQRRHRHRPRRQGRRRRPASPPASASCAATRWRWSRSARASRSGSSARSSASPRSHIAPGEWVHEHNTGLHDFERDYRFAEDANDDGLLPPRDARDLRGLPPRHGQAGTRNYIGILTSVNCSASVARFAAAEVERSGCSPTIRSIDGVVAIVHGTGCGHAAYGEGFDVLRRTQWGYASHPNFAGVVMVGLGCEVFQIGRMKKEYGLVGDRHLPHPDDPGDRRHEEDRRGDRGRDPRHAADRRAARARDAAGLGARRSRCNAAARTAIRASPPTRRSAPPPISSCATAAPRSCPRRRRSTAPSTCSPAAPRRARSARSSSTRIHWWEDYTARNGGEMNNNPSPGNKAGGLTTILEKSLGAAAKGGQSTLRAVYEYAEQVQGARLRLHGHARLRSRRRDGQVAGGANLICFTTGRGSAFGVQAGALDQARDELRHLPPHDRRHGHQLRRHPRRRLDRGEGRRRFSRRCCASPPASARSRRNSATATPSSCPGRSAR